MNWKTFAADYLTFSKKDRIAALVFAGAILLMYLLAHAFPKAAPVAVLEDTVTAKLLDSAIQLAQTHKEESAEDNVSQYGYEVSKKSEIIEGNLFAFDPNTLDAAGWKSLGLRERTIKTILAYRSKGGHFYKNADLKKIWGLPQGFYERVQEYIEIANDKKEYAANTNFFKTPYEKKSRTITVVDVNTADTSALIALPGIGSKLAQRIIAFRNKLGGFYTTDQIGETYGLPDSTFQTLKPYLQVHGVLKKFNINTATKDELKIHPYIKWNLANALVEYRNQHGPFKKLEDIKKIVLIDETTYQKLAPYVELE